MKLKIEKNLLKKGKIKQILYKNDIMTDIFTI